jgi:hypothetical protein
VSAKKVSSPVAESNWGHFTVDNDLVADIAVGVLRDLGVLTSRYVLGGLGLRFWLRFGLGGLFGDGSLAGNRRFGLSGLGGGDSCAVVAVSAPELTKMPPRLNATTAVMITVGQPNRFGFFSCC